ncbi:TniB family NTP-binding protein [Thauera humireducens]|uniref:TniB family NTP-binding protein n=1 Tax=Thauera humireducens TaxID=1134435 RepID=UPI00311E992A
MNTNDDEYLDEETAAIASLDNLDRIAHLRKDLYVPHNEATTVLEELELLFNEPDVIRPQGRQLISNPLMGKTTLIDRFCKDHPASDNLGGDHAHVPVLNIEHPDNPHNQIYSTILSRLGVPHKLRPSPSQLADYTIDLMKKVGVRILLIDEFHSALHGGPATQRASLDTVKHIMNSLRRPIVLVGTSEVASATTHDIQISSRFKIIPLRRFNYIKDPDSFEDLLEGFQGLLPLRKCSDLSAPELAELIFRITEGVVGEIKDLLVRAATQAIEDGTEKITPEILEACSSSPLTASS